MREVEEELQQAEVKLVQLEDELDGRINLARQVRRIQDVEISRLRKSLAASEKIVHHQQAVLKKQREQLKEQRFGWVQSNGKLQAQLEE